MKYATLLFAALVALVTLALQATAQDPAPGENIETVEQTLIGAYHWERGETKGELKAVFTPSGEGSWDVAFHFDFRGDAHTYTGEAKGSLTDGSLEGTVLNEDKNRTFTFEGTVEEGKFEGTHAEVGGRRGSRQTGTLTLG